MRMQPSASRGPSAHEAERMQHEWLSMILVRLRKNSTLRAFQRSIFTGSLAGMEVLTLFAATPRTVATMYDVHVRSTSLRLSSLR